MLTGRLSFPLSIWRSVSSLCLRIGIVLVSCKFINRAICCLKSLLCCCCCHTCCCTTSICVIINCSVRLIVVSSRSNCVNCSCTCTFLTLELFDRPPRTVPPLLLLPLLVFALRSSVGTVVRLRQLVPNQANLSYLFNMCQVLYFA